MEKKSQNKSKKESWRFLLFFSWNSLIYKFFMLKSLSISRVVYLESSHIRQLFLSSYTISLCTLFRIWGNLPQIDIKFYSQAKRKKEMLQLCNLYHSHIKVITLNYKSNLHVYLREITVKGDKSLKAPSLNFKRDFPFDVVPSGKIINGKTSSYACFLAFYKNFSTLYFIFPTIVYLAL